MTSITTSTISRLIAAGIAVALLTAASRAETVEQLYEKAKAEKSLVFYAGGPTAPYEARIKLFQEKFPGIQVSVEGGFSNVLNQKIEQQLSAGKLDVDFAFFQTVQDFVNWKKRGVLLPFKPDGFDQIIPNLRDPDGAYMAFAAVTIAYAYNTSLVRAEDVPKSALDFLKPAFQGKLISVYPHDDDAALYLFHLIVQKYGWSCMDRYMANKPQFIQGHLPVARAIAEGKMAATLDATVTTAGGLKRQGFADRDRVLGRGRDAGVHRHRRHLQGRAASERCEAVPDLVSRQRAAGAARHLLAAARRAAAAGLQSADLLQDRQFVPRVHHQRRADRGPAQALRGLYRPGGERGRGAVKPTPRTARCRPCAAPARQRER